MLRVGLSGGIGSGKSTVARLLGGHGAVVIDADVLAREVVAPGSPALAEVGQRFGPGVLTAAGGLDRAALAAVVFADEASRRDLELITHPRIAARTAELVAAAPADAVVVHDVPLLVEKRMGAGYHLVVVVGADDATRLARLTGLRGMDPAEGRRRMASQASDVERRAAADVWLDNSGSPAQLAAAVARLWEERLVPFERNVRHGIPAQRAAGNELSGPDPTWPAQARRLMDRVALALGETPATVHHVGSTSVPRLPAKDVIDLQIGVRALAAAAEPAVVERLRAAGFPPVDGVRGDTPHDGRGTWPKRFHAAADPGRPVNLHVREVGGAGWRWALLVRDWLRAQPEEARAYAAEKERVVAAAPSPQEYAAAKERWFSAAAVRAEEWAARRGWSPAEAGGGHG